MNVFEARFGSQSFTCGTRCTQGRQNGEGAVRGVLSQRVCRSRVPHACGTGAGLEPGNVSGGRIDTQRWLSRMFQCRNFKSPLPLATSEGDKITGMRHLGWAASGLSKSICHFSLYSVRLPV